MKKIIAIIILLLVCIGIIISGFFIFNRKESESKIESIIQEVWDNSFDENTPDFLLEINKKSSYKIVEIIEEDYLLVKTKVKGVNLAKALDESEFKEAVNDKNKIDELLIEVIKQCEPFETEANIYVYKLNDEYQVKFSETFVNAMSGNIYSSFMDELTNQ